MSTNPVEVSRKFLWAKLSGDSSLMTLVTNRIFPSRPPQGTAYPFIYFEHIATQGLPIAGRGGFYAPFAETLWRVHVVGDRDATYEDIDPILTEVIAALNRKFSILGDGNQASVAIDPTAPISQPFDIEADQYPRYIVPCRVPVSFN
jgi:hypothetical protein